MNKARHYHFNSTMPDQVDSAQRAVHRDQNFLLAGGFTVILIVLALLVWAMSGYINEWSGLMVNFAN